MAQPKRRLDVGYVVLEAGLGHLVMSISPIAKPRPSIRAHPVQREAPGLVGNRLIIRAKHPAFDRAHVLRHIETEATCVAEGSNLATSVPGFNRVGGVLQNQELVAFGDLEQRGHLARSSREMNWNDRPRSRRNRGLDPR